MMKKSLIALAVAGLFAAPAFAADISATVEQAYSDTDVNGTVATDRNEWRGSSDNFITVSGSEDLGGGMTAFASITLDVDSTDATSLTKDQVVGVKGAFGTILGGRFEDFTEGKLMSRMTLEGDGSASGGAVENGVAAFYAETVLGQAAIGTNAGRTNHGVAYVSPTVSGFHVGIGGYMVDNVANSWDSKTTDATDIAVFYDNGPLSVAVSNEKLNYGGTKKDQKSLVATASFTLGDAKLTYLRQELDNIAGVDTLDAETNAFRVDYKFGANTVTAALNNTDYSKSGSADVGTETWSVELAHNLSKRTKAYINYADGEIDGAVLDADALTIGLKHSF